MGFNCGIVGLPNVGKSTLFNAMTAAHVPSANYPFCTIDQNTGMVAVPDKRLTDIADIFKPKSLVPTQVEFVDIAGLVEGASKGEGLGNKFLGHIREVDAIAHVVRCFDAPDVVPTYDTVDPIRDIEVINMELALADLDVVTKGLDKLAPKIRSGDKESKQVSDIFEKLKSQLEKGTWVRLAGLSEEEMTLISTYRLLTSKPVVYVLNMNESDVRTPSDRIKHVRAFATKEHAPVVEVCAAIEAELVDLNEAERKEFLEDLGLHEPGLNRLITAGYTLLNLITYFTAGEKEVRAWTIAAGTKAPQAAGVIHSDFERGFIRAEVYHYNDLMKFGSELKVKEAGKLRSEGSEYVVKDGDIVHFRFNV